MSHNARSVGQSPFDPHGQPLSTRKLWGLPHLEKTRRSVSCTVAGCTKPQKPWGENHGFQNRATAFIHQSQPTHAFAAGQTQLIHRIHLPGLVRTAGALLLAGGASAWRRWRELVVLKPTLQRSHTGAGLVRFVKHHVNQATAPPGMLLPHLDGLLEGHALNRELLGAATGIVGSEGLLAALREAAHQMTHRALGQLEFLSELGHRVAFLPAMQNSLPDGNGNRGGHEIILHDVCQVQSHASMLFCTAVAAKPYVAINGKTVCRVTEYLTPGLAAHY